MINPVSSTSFSDAFGTASAPQPQTPDAPAPAPISAAAPPVADSGPDRDVRLTVDHAADGPTFVYTLRDRSTGQILAQLPREAAADLGQSPDYQAGQLVRAKA